MNQNIIDKVMHFIRRDGPEDAPICFLTIEDGGEFIEKDFDNYINGDDHWTPKDKDRPLKYTNTGLPGEFISKIISGIFDSFDKWGEYRSSNLYSHKECNIKFYPIGQKKTSIWPKWLEEKLNLTNTEYIIKCLAERHKVIYGKLKHIFVDSSVDPRFFIILAAKDEWSYFLKTYTFKTNEVIKQLNKQYGYEFFYDANKRLLFSYYPMFKRGARLEESLTQFCNELKKQLPKNLLNRIS